MVVEDAETGYVGAVVRVEYGRIDLEDRYGKTRGFPHLKVLKTARLVCDRPAGTRRVYQLDPTGLAALRTDLDRFWTRALTGYAQLIDSEGDDT